MKKTLILTLGVLFLACSKEDSITKNSPTQEDIIRHTSSDNPMDSIEKTINLKKRELITETQFSSNFIDNFQKINAEDLDIDERSKLKGYLIDLAKHSTNIELPIAQMFDIQSSNMTQIMSFISQREYITFDEVYFLFTYLKSKDYLFSKKELIYFSKIQKKLSKKMIINNEAIKEFYLSSMMRYIDFFQETPLPLDTNDILKLNKVRNNVQTQKLTFIYLNNLKKFNTQDRDLFIKWDRNKINKAQILAGLDTVNTSEFMNSYFKIKDFRENSQSTIKKDYDEIKLVLKGLLEKLYSSKNKAKNLLSLTSQDRNLYLEPGIYTLAPNTVLENMNFEFSSLALIEAPSLNISFKNSNLKDSWIDTSGINAKLDQSEIPLSDGQVPEMSYVDIPDPKVKNSTKTFKNNANKSVPEKFCKQNHVQQHKSPSFNTDFWKKQRLPQRRCITLKSYQHSKGKEPSQQRSGPYGGNGGSISLINTNLTGKSILASNGGNGAKGYQGANSPLCRDEGGLIYYYPIDNIKSIHVFACRSVYGCAEKDQVKGLEDAQSHAMFRKFYKQDIYPEKLDEDSPLIHVSRGKSGNGGNGGNGGIIRLSTNAQSNTIKVLTEPGLGGPAGELAPCGPKTDLEEKDITTLKGNNGQDGLSGTLEK